MLKMESWALNGLDSRIAGKLLLKQMYEDLTGEEMSHLVGITQRHQGPVNEGALADCIRTILAEHQASAVATEDDLMALRNQFKERKGMKV